MKITMKQAAKPAGALRTARILSAAVLLAGNLALTVAPARAAGACSTTATSLQIACEHDTQDSFFEAQAICTNLAASAARATCLARANADLEEGDDLCEDQRAARGDVCAAVGQGRYDPSLNPTRFVDPRQIGRSISPNPYLLLVPGYVRVYQSSEETITVTVTSSTIVIAGIRCAVVRDTVTVGGQLKEDTFDYFAQDRAGNVWYFGEDVQDFENGRLVSLDGTWRAGEQGAKPGFAMKAAPVVGETYRQEFALGEAEDMGQILSKTGSRTAAAASCSGNCLVTRDFSPLSSASDENKVFASGIGEIAAFHVDNPEDAEELVSYTFPPAP